MSGFGDVGVVSWFDCSLCLWFRVDMFGFDVYACLVFWL